MKGQLEAGGIYIMILFNKKRYSMDMVEDSTVFIENETQNVVIINSSARCIFNGLLEQENIQQIVDKYIRSNLNGELDTDYDTILYDFSNASSLMFEKGILIDV